MLGPGSLWRSWRKELPNREEIASAALLRLKLWASLLDPDFKHSVHVSRLALQLYDGLGANGRPPPSPAQDRAVLQVAALLHDVGRSKDEKGAHKTSYKMIRRLSAPLGWSEQDLLTAGIIARKHRGALPRAGQKALRGLSPSRKRDVARLGGILRLANAFDEARDGHIQRVHVLSRNGLLTIAAQGFSPRDRTAEAVSAARYLLETVYRRPVVVKPMRMPMVKAKGHGPASAA